MLIPFDNLTRQYSFTPKGVLHCGAHEGQEREMYDRICPGPVVWIEANPELYRRLLKNLVDYPRQTAIHACVSNVDGQKVKFHITNNDGQSSSILDLGTHKDVHPEVRYTHDIELTTSRIDMIDYDFSGLDFLNMDLQGAEMLALEGMGDMLDQFNYLYLEVNWAELYKKCTLFPDLTKWLKERGFKAIHWAEAGQAKWGDCFYIRI